MSIFKDWREDTEGYVLSYRLKELVNPRQWLRLHRWRKQRADRGWSDRDTWGAGEHIAKMTSEMLQHLNDNTYVDWPEWFKLNVQEKGGYKSLQAVIDDINQYLVFTETSWADGLETVKDSVEEVFEKREDGSYDYKSPGWVDKNGKKLTEKQITARIKNWSKKVSESYEKAQKAMEFFGRHFAGFWD